MPHFDDNIVRCGIFCAFLCQPKKTTAFLECTRRVLCESTRMF